MEKIRLYYELTAIITKITSKKTLRIVSKIGLIFLSILALIILPYAIFAIHHILTGNTGLYTYLDNTSTVKGEPINILIRYSDVSKVIERMKEGGWKEVPTYSTNNQSTWKFSVAKGITPVSPRYFNGETQRYSLEGPDSTVFHRHHARFWNLNGSVYGAVSYDSGVTVTFKNIIPIPTHIVNQDIDTERNSLGKIISKQSGLIITYEDNTFPILFKNNNAGSWFYTDGEIIILTRNQELSETNSQKNMLHLRRIYFKFLGIIMNLF